MTSPSQKTVAILGAGPAGLISAKEAIINGIVPTVFEKHSDLGGIWNPQSGSTWDTLRTNKSIFSMRFSDFDWSQYKDTEMFLSCQDMYEYLNEFANKWNIRKHCKFQSKVIKVLPVASKMALKGDKGWNVSWISMDSDNMTLKSKIFDAVFVATGVFADAYIPSDIKGLEKFPGKVIHSKDYQIGKEFENQRVLIVGGSISGPDLACDVSHHAQKTVHCFRTPLFILGRYVPDITRNNAKLPFDLVLFQNRNYYKNLPPMPEAEVLICKNNFLLSLCQEQEEFDVLRIPPEALSKPINFCISDIYIDQLRKGKLQPVRQNILEIQGSKVKFENGETYELDAIIMATGFNVSSGEIFQQDILDTIGYDQSDRFVPFIMYKSTLHPDLKNLFFIGMFRGAPLFVMEQQARWACRLLTNQVEMPSREVLIDGLKAEQKIKDARPRPQLPHADFTSFAEEFAKLSNSLPDLDKLQDDKFTLAEALGASSNRGDIASLENQKDEICKYFMNSPVFSTHFNLCDNPQETLNNMRYMEEVIAKFN